MRKIIFSCATICIVLLAGCKPFDEPNILFKNVADSDTKAVQQSNLSTAIAFIGHPYQAGIILITPPVFINGGLGIFSMLWLEKRLRGAPINKHAILFMFTLILFNIGEFFNYVCLQSFSNHADVGLFLRYFNLSPWVVFIPGSYISVWAFAKISGNIRNKFFLNIQLSSTMRTLVHFWICFIYLIFQPLTVMGFHLQSLKFNPVVNFIVILCLLIFPISFYALWPKNNGGNGFNIN